jgi:hypothetical protein
VDKIDEISIRVNYRHPFTASRAFHLLDRCHVRKRGGNFEVCVRGDYPCPSKEFAHLLCESFRDIAVRVLAIACIVNCRVALLNNRQSKIFEELRGLLEIRMLGRDK